VLIQSVSNVRKIITPQKLTGNADGSVSLWMLVWCPSAGCSTSHCIYHISDHETISFGITKGSIISKAKRMMSEI
jgi:hypothetical protein